MIIIRKKGSPMADTPPRHITSAALAHHVLPLWGCPRLTYRNGGEKDARKEPKKVPKGCPNLKFGRTNGYKNRYKLTALFGSDLEAIFHQNLMGQM